MNINLILIFILIYLDIKIFYKYNKMIFAVSITKTMDLSFVWNFTDLSP